MLHLLAAACLTASLATALPAAASTQGPGEDYPKAVVLRATTLTRALAQRIHLNEGQYVQVRRIHLRYLNERHELEINLAGAPAAERDEKLAASQCAYEQALTALLQPVQRVAYQQLRASFTAHRL